MTRITEQIERVRGRVENAAERSGRDPRSIRIVAVSKKHPPSAIREAQAAGLRRFGENYVQEALPKIDEIEAPIEWHYIGPIQSNKAAPIAEHFDWVHTVSSAKVARRLSARRPPEKGDLQACIQVRATDAPERAGIDAADVEALASLIEQLPGIRFRGLMIMPLPGQSTDAIRGEFARTRELLANLNEAGHAGDTLSMGMSGDLEAAIIEGSTLVRIGTDIFGPRPNDGEQTG
ncbi:MAG: YggS family pyridoxal phosphate-dependent enzyme [Gammaproteobacteria bacterium]